MVSFVWRGNGIEGEEEGGDVFKWCLGKCSGLGMVTL